MLAISAAILLVFRPAIYSAYPKKKTEPNAMNAQHKQGEMIMVSINNRHFYLAESTSQSHFKLLYVPKSADLSVGDEVKTSGFDGTFEADVPIGKIVSIQENLDNIYLDVEIISSQP